AIRTHLLRIPEGLLVTKNDVLKDIRQGDVLTAFEKDDGRFVDLRLAKSAKKKMLMKNKMSLEEEDDEAGWWTTMPMAMP
ncbi:unnamed protein product, partial [Amoebophrya sp. A25]